MNYYRVTVNGRADGNQLRYLSGFFDEEALDIYFNTFSQSKDGALLKPQVKQTGEGATAAAEKLSEDERREADPKNEGRKLVLLLSQNSEAVAEQIGSLAQSKAFADVVGKLVFADEIADLQGERLKASRATGIASRLKSNATALGEKLEDGSLAGDRANEQLLSLLKQVIAEMGGADAIAGIDTFAQARAWIDENRAELMEAAR